VFEHRGLGLPVAEVRGRDARPIAHASPVPGVGRPHAHQPVLVRQHQWAQEQVIHKAEDGGIDADADGQREITWFVQQMQPYPQAMFDVQGFADSTGSEAKNAGLSQQRAEAVADYLASQGIDASRMVTKGFGTASPAASNVTSQGRRNNRRVEVTVR